jgi:hypothetical protein
MLIRTETSRQSSQISPLTSFSGWEAAALLPSPHAVMPAPLLARRLPAASLYSFQPGSQLGTYTFQDFFLQVLRQSVYQAIRMLENFFDGVVDDVVAAHF